MSTKVLQRIFQSVRKGATIKIDAIVTADFAKFLRSSARQTFSLTVCRTSRLKAWHLSSASEHRYLHLPGEILLLDFLNLGWFEFLFALLAFLSDDKVIFFGGLSIELLLAVVLIFRPLSLLAALRTHISGLLLHLLIKK